MPKPPGQDLTETNAICKTWDSASTLLFQRWFGWQSPVYRRLSSSYRGVDRSLPATPTRAIFPTRWFCSRPTPGSRILGCIRDVVGAHPVACPLDQSGVDVALSTELAVTSLVNAGVQRLCGWAEGSIRALSLNTVCTWFARIKSSGCSASRLFTLTTAGSLSTSHFAARP